MQHDVSYGEDSINNTTGMNNGPKVFDPGGRHIEENYKLIPHAQTMNCSISVQDTEEDIPPDLPNQYGKPLRITCHVDAGHAHCKITRRSVTGIVLFVNNMPIRWISKKQKTVGTNTYGSELVTVRIAIDLIIEIRYT